ncbi:MAG TPA: secretin N-terminal domain-containing protein, partial [Halomicronema sp.]
PPNTPIPSAMPVGPSAQIPPAPTTPTSFPSSPNVLVPQPEITINGQPAPPTANLPNIPPAISGPSAAPPVLPRAVAPPVGDIAAATTDPSPSSVDLGTNERIPRLVLRDAPVRDVLALLARAAGLNIAFTSDSATPGAAPAAPGAAGTAGPLGPTISLDIENERVQDVFNYVLRLSGLQANKLGRTIFVGTRLPNEVNDTVVRTFRLNQVTARQASGFLASMGAESAITSTREVTQVTAVPIQGTDQAITRTNTTVQTTIDTLRFSPQDGQPLLRGLQVLVDERLNSVTLVGPRRMVEIASTQLVQLDLRRRQVAVNVKIIDVNLAANDNFNSSFSFGVGDSFFVNDQGSAVFNFGGANPPLRNQVVGTPANPILNNPPLIRNQVGGENLETFSPFFDQGSTTNIPLTAPGPGGVSLSPIAPIGRDQDDVGLQTYTPATGTTLGTGTFSLFPFIQYPRRFLSLLQAQVTSGNAKILTDPTLVVQEGETATVNLTQDVIGNIQTQTTASNPPQITTTAQIQKAGLILGINIQRIDDNGFITLNVTPKVTAVADTQDFSGTTIALLSERSLNSGSIRLRDGQTLILSGIIQEQDRVTSSKIPLLGDLPIIGALFRSTTRNNTRAEVIVVLTPQVMDDSDRSPFGYGYTPGPDVRPLIQRQMLPGGTPQ